MDMIRALLRRNKINFVYRIGYLSNHLVGPVYKASEKEFGIQRAHFATLLCLQALDQITATDVVTLSGIPKNSVSRAVNKLLADDLIVSMADEEDGRKFVLSITPRGRSLYDRISPAFRESQKRLLDVLSPAEQEQLDRLLDKLVSQDDEWTRPTCGKV